MHDSVNDRRRCVRRLARARYAIVLRGPLLMSLDRTFTPPFYSSLILASHTPHKSNCAAIDERLHNIQLGVTHDDTPLPAEYGGFRFLVSGSVDEMLQIHHITVGRGGGGGEGCCPGGTPRLRCLHDARGSGIVRVACFQEVPLAFAEVIRL